MGLLLLLLQTSKSTLSNIPINQSHLFPDLPTSASVWPDHRSSHDPHRILHSCLPADGCGTNAAATTTTTAATDITVIVGSGVLDRVLEQFVRTLVQQDESIPVVVSTSSARRKEESHAIRLAVGPPMLQVWDWLLASKQTTTSISHAEIQQTLHLWWDWHCRIHRQYQRHSLLTIPLDVLLTQPRTVERQMAAFLRLPGYDSELRYNTITGGKVDMKDAAAAVLDLVDRVDTAITHLGDDFFGEYQTLPSTTTAAQFCQERQVHRPMVSEHVQQLAEQLLQEEGLV